MDGPTHLGLLEVLVGTKSSGICSNQFESANANVICATLGFQREGAFWSTEKMFPTFVPKMRRTTAFFKCKGNEATIENCTIVQRAGYCSDFVIVGCRSPTDNSLRIVETNRSIATHRPQPRSGKLEIQSFGTWGSICISNFSREDAIVACKTLGLETKGAAGMTAHELSLITTPNSTVVWYNGFGCIGNEASLTDCDLKNSFEPFGCFQTLDVFIDCEVSSCKFGEYVKAINSCAICPAGYNCASELKTPCPAGTYQEQEGQISCKACPLGTHQSEEGSIECVPCPRGLFCNTTTGAHKCLPGTYQPFYFSVACLPCPPGHFQPMEASTECLVCPAGKMCPTGASKPIDCAPGSYQNLKGQNNCKACLSGYYQLDTGSTEMCHPCPHGHRCLASSTQPEECPTGTKSEDGDCTLCPGGTYQDEARQSNCKSCSPGHICPEGSVTPLPCEPSHFQRNPGATTCSRCPSNSYTLEPGQESCLKCPAGHVCKPGENPKPCDPGTFANSHYCSACPPGYYQPLPAKDQCLPCPAGHFCSSTDRMNPLLCAPGTYNLNSAQAECTPCPVGHYCPFKGTKYPLGCPPGTYHDRNGAISCITCPFGTYQVQTGAAMCYKCRSQQFCNETITFPKGILPLTSVTNSQHHRKVIVCPVGHKITTYPIERCIPCPQGSYQNRINSKECLRCPLGYACSVGTVSPIPCQPGSYSYHQSKCQKCTSSMYADKPASTSCKRCPLGHQCPNRAASPIACEPGTFGHYGRCDQCRIGTYQPRYSNRKCLSCPSGFVCPKGSKKPLKCKPGFYAKYNSINSECTKCETGHKCPFSGMSVAHKCPVGHYQNIREQTSCKKCADGSYQLFRGSAYCKTCPNGHFCPNATELPKPCPVNHYQTSTKGASCIPCPKLKYQPKTGQSTCISCPGGYKCPFLFLPKETNADPKTGENKEASTINTHGDSSAIEDTEKLGEQGAKGGDVGDNTSETSDGPEDTSNGEERHTSKTNEVDPPEPPTFEPRPCAPGEYSSVGDGVCTPCKPGHFSSKYGSHRCEASPDGTYTPGDGNRKPYLCPNGYAVNCHAEPGCNKCPKGRAAGSGSKNCGPVNVDEDDEDKCRGVTWPCVWKQMRCVGDALLNYASGGLYGYATLAWELFQEAQQTYRGVLGNRKKRETSLLSPFWGTPDFGPKTQARVENTIDQQKMQNKRKTSALKEIKRTENRFEPHNRSQKGLGFIIRALKWFNMANNLADKKVQDSINIFDVGYEAAGAINDFIDAIDFPNLKNGKWYNRVLKKVKSLRDRIPSIPVKNLKLAKIIGRKIPLVCNLIEGFSKECRQMFACLSNKIGRKKRQTAQNLAPENSAKRFIALLSPFVDYFQKHPEVHLFMKFADEECRSKFTDSWSKDAGDASPYISRAEIDLAKPFCLNSTVEGVFDIEMVSKVFNRSFEQLAKGNYAGSFLEDMTNGWAIASEALPEDFVAKNHSDDDVMKIIQGFLLFAEIGQTTKIAEGYIVPINKSSESNHIWELHLLLPNATIDYSGTLLTEFSLPVDENDNECLLWNVIGGNPKDYQKSFKVRENMDSGFLYVEDVVTEGSSPSYVLVCR